MAGGDGERIVLAQAIEVRPHLGADLHARILAIERVAKDGAHMGIEGARLHRGVQAVSVGAPAVELAERGRGIQIIQRQRGETAGGAIL